MRTIRRNPARRGYIILIALATLAIILAFEAVLARCALIEFQRDRQTRITTWATQVFASTRDWSYLHADQITDAPLPIPLRDLLPPEIVGEATLRRVQSSDGVDLVECNLSLKQSRTRVRQTAQWPLPVAPTPAPE